MILRKIVPIIALLVFSNLSAQDKQPSIFKVDQVPAIPGKVQLYMFILDHSASLSERMIALRDRELSKALHSLPRDSGYQVVLFGGGAVFASPGWSAIVSEDFTVTDPKRNKYIFKSGSTINDWEFKGSDSDLPTTKWLRVNDLNIKNTLDSLSKFELFLGTDWLVGLKVGHLMKPPPSVIYFMSDGTGGNAPRPILEMNKKLGAPVINTYGLQTTDGAKQFFQIATETGGEFRIIQRNGKAEKVTNPVELEF